MTKNAVALTALMLVACFASSAVSYCPQSHLSVNNNNMKSTDTIASGSRRFGSVLRMQGGGAAAKDVKIGFLGMGIMGAPMAINLLKAGYAVTVWNRAGDKCAPAVEAGAKQGSSAAEVVKECDITFAMLSDPAAAEAVLYGRGCGPGALDGISSGKGYVDCSTVSPECSAAIAAAVREKGGLYLEAPVSGSKKPAIDGQLIFLCGGDKALYETCEPLLEVMGKKHLLLGEVGAGAKMKLVVNMVMSSMLASLSEGMALAKASDITTADLLDVMANGAVANPMFAMKGPLMEQANYAPAFPLKHAQKDLRLAVQLADELGVAMPVAAAVNERFKQVRGKGDGDLDFSAVHKNYQ